eukprot:9465563-Pyramimonas_sp.AAC.1
MEMAMDASWHWADIHAHTRTRCVNHRPHRRLMRNSYSASGMHAYILPNIKHTCKPALAEG